MFLNLVMLAGIGGAAAPLVLHLLARARYRTVDWGAMMFLEGLDPRHAQSARLKQYILLAMRMALVSLLAVTLARPVVRSQWAAGAEGNVTAVLVLDCSYSLATLEAGRSRFDKVREAALQILSGLKRGDSVSLIVLGEQVEVRHAEPTDDLQGAAREVAALQVSMGSANVVAGLEAARQVLERSSSINRELYIICDRQARNWQGLEQETSLTRWVHDRSGGARTRFFVVPVGGEEAGNVSVEGVELADGPAVRNQPAEVLLRIRNHDATPRVGMEVKLTVWAPSDINRLANPAQKPVLVPVNVGPFEAATVRIGGVTFREAGPHVLGAQVHAPGLEADNQFESAIDVLDPIATLILSGDERMERVRRESFFLKLALAPYQSAGRRSGDPAVVEVKGVEELPGGTLGDYQVIILANVPQLSAEQAHALEQRIYEGAGLIVAPGGLTRIEAYNSILWRDGQGLLPAKLLAPTGADGSGATSLLGLETTHPVFRFRRGGDPLPGAVIGRYFPVEVRSGDGRKLAHYTSGDPFLVEATRGRGRVLMLTTPLDADWGTLPLTSFYLPFAQSLVRYAYAPPQAERNLAMGDPIVASFEERIDQVRVNDVSAMQFVGAAGTQLRYPLTQRPGVYRVTVRIQGERAWRIGYYVVRPDRGESDLTPMTVERWRATERSMGFVRIDGATSELGRRLAGQRAGWELWPILLAGVVLLAIAEVGLTRFWTEGAP